MQKQIESSRVPSRLDEMPVFWMPKSQEAPSDQQEDQGPRDDHVATRHEHVATRHEDANVRTASKRQEETSSSDPLIGQVVARDWVVESLLGSGSFGSVYSVVSQKTGESAAVKIEMSKHNLLPYEAKIYKVL
jgi:hypothetical protein